MRGNFTDRRRVSAFSNCFVNVRKNSLLLIGEIDHAAYDTSTNVDMSTTGLESVYFNGTIVSQTKLFPNLRCRLDNPIQFLPHLVFAEGFRIDAAETALWAQGEPLEWQVAAGLIDAALEIVYGFQIWALGRD